MTLKIIVRDSKKESMDDIESSINTYLEHHDGEIQNVSVDDGKVYFFIKT